MATSLWLTVPRPPPGDRPPPLSLLTSRRASEPCRIGRVEGRRERKSGETADCQTAGFSQNRLGVTQDGDGDGEAAAQQSGSVCSASLVLCLSQ